MSEQQLIVMNDELKRRVEELHSEIARLRHERDMATAKMVALLPQGTPEELAEIERAMASAVPLDLGGLIAELEAQEGH